MGETAQLEICQSPFPSGQLSSTERKRKRSATDLARGGSGNSEGLPSGVQAKTN